MPQLSQHSLHTKRKNPGNSFQIQCNCSTVRRRGAALHSHSSTVRCRAAPHSNATVRPPAAEGQQPFSNSIAPPFAAEGQLSTLTPPPFAAGQLQIPMPPPARPLPRGSSHSPIPLSTVRRRGAALQSHRSIACCRGAAPLLRASPRELTRDPRGPDRWGRGPSSTPACLFPHPARANAGAKSCHRWQSTPARVGATMLTSTCFVGGGPWTFLRFKSFAPFRWPKTSHAEVVGGTHAHSAGRGEPSP